MIVITAHDTRFARESHQAQLPSLDLRDAKSGCSLYPILIRERTINTITKAPATYPLVAPNNNRLAFLEAVRSGALG
jgi:hypothetical protein